MAPVVKVKGIPYTFSDRVLVIPPLSLGAMEQLQERLSVMKEDLADPEYIGTVIETVHAALKRNYPDMTREEVADMIDLANMQEVMTCAMDVAGLKRKALEAGQGDEPGEHSAGRNSTRTSRTGPAGRSRTSAKS
jgi:hypothetical protein